MLTKEEFEAIQRETGLSVEQIIEFEERRERENRESLKQEAMNKDELIEDSSFLSKIFRTIFRSSVLDKIQTSQYLLDKMPEVEPGESWKDYKQKVNAILEPREKRIMAKGALSQLETPFAGALFTGAVAAPKALAFGAAKYGTLEATSELMGLNRLIEGISSPLTKDVAEISKVLIQGGLARRKWLSDKQAGFLKAKIKTPIDWVKDAFTGAKKAQKAALLRKQAIVTETQAKVSGLRKQKAALLRKQRLVSDKESMALQREVDGLTRSLQIAEKRHGREVKKLAFLKSKEVRQELPKIYKKQSEEFGRGFREVLKKNPATATREELLPEFEDNLLSHGILKIEGDKVLLNRSPVTRAETKILSEYFRIKRLPTNSTIDVGELVQSSALIKPKFGKPWSSSEHLQASISESLSKIVAVKSPEVAKFRSRYAPYLQWKEATIKEFAPFKGRYATKKGTRILSKYGEVSKDANKVLNDDEVALIRELEKQLGKSVTQELRQTRKLGQEIIKRKAEIPTIKADKQQIIDQRLADKKQVIDDMIAEKIDILNADKNFKINDIDRATQEIVNELRIRRIIIGVGAALTAGRKLMDYIRNRLSFGLLGITGG